MIDFRCAYGKEHKVIDTTISVLYEGYLYSIPTKICIDKDCVTRRGGTFVMNATGPRVGYGT